MDIEYKYFELASLIELVSKYAFNLLFVCCNMYEQSSSVKNSLKKSRNETKLTN